MTTSSKNYTNMGIPKLSAVIDISGLNIVSGVFNYISPSDVTGQFTGTLDSSNGLMTYQLENDDIDEVGIWKFWAVFTDSNGRTARGDTTEVNFNDDAES